MKKILFEIVTPEKIVFKDEIDALSVPTIDGQITIMSDHIPIITMLKSGEITIKKGNDTTYLALSNGFLEVSDNHIKIIADNAEHAEEIDIKIAEEARIRAQKAKETANTRKEIALAEAALQHALAQIKVANRKKRSHL